MSTKLPNPSESNINRLSIVSQNTNLLNKSELNNLALHRYQRPSRLQFLDQNDKSDRSMSHHQLRSRRLRYTPRHLPQFGTIKRRIEGTSSRIGSFLRRAGR